MIITRTLGETADWLKCSPLTIRRLWMRGEFPPPINIGRIIRWRESDILKWLEEQPASSLYSKETEHENC